MTYNNLDTTDDAIICCPKCKKKDDTAGIYHGDYGKKLNVLKPTFPKKKKLPDMFITKNEKKTTKKNKKNTK
tara:strand:+ start:1117 stop:1332 length:216 start_codon:yes stop_codon:yes gene_type:complete